MATEEEILQALDGELMRAARLRDAAKMEELLHPDYRTVNEDGSARDRAEALAEMRGATPLPIDSIPQPSEYLIRRMGDTAFISARMKFGPAELRYLEVWVKSDGTWKFVQWQATRVTPEGLEREARVKNQQPS